MVAALPFLEARLADAQLLGDLRARFAGLDPVLHRLLFEGFVVTSGLGAAAGVMARVFSFLVLMVMGAFALTPHLQGVHQSG